jgi:hypothetical protein
MRTRSDAKLQQEQQFQKQQQDTAIAARAAEVQAEYAHEEKMENIKGEFSLEEQQINAYGRAALSDDPNSAYDRIQKDTQSAITNNFTQIGLGLKAEENIRKQNLDSEQKKLELAKLQQKNEEIKLKRDKMSSDERISLWNKN